jgi:hypothetical protein
LIGPGTYSRYKYTFPAYWDSASPTILVFGPLTWNPYNSIRPKYRLFRKADAPVAQNHGMWFFYHILPPRSCQHERINAITSGGIPKVQLGDDMKKGQDAILQMQMPPKSTNIV